MAAYIYGNTVRKEQNDIPERVESPSKASRRVRANRLRAMRMSRGYVIFLAVSSVAALFACVRYLGLQSDIAERSEHIAVLQEELEEAREDNTTRYNLIINRMNLEQIRDVAVNDFGMVYANPEQVIRYRRGQDAAVTQFTGIPESGIAAGADIPD